MSFIPQPGTSAQRFPLPVSPSGRQLAVFALALTLWVAGQSAPLAADNNATSRKALPARVYAITPSSEPANIDGPSTLNIYDSQLKLVKQILPFGLKPHHFYKIPDRNLALITHFAPTGYVELMDLNTDEIVDTIAAGLGPRHLTFSPDKNHAYTADFDGDTITRIHLNSRTSKTVPAHGMKPNYVEYVKTPKGPLLLVANFGEASISVIHPHSLKLIKKIPVGAGPFNLVHSEACECVVTANAMDNTVSWIDLNTLTEIERVNLLTPQTVLNLTETQRLNPRISPEGKFVWIGNQQGSEFAVFDLFSRKRVATIPAGYGADIAFFPRTGPGKGYAFGTSRYDFRVTVAKLNGRKPPTFHRDIPVTFQGTHYITFNEGLDKAYVSQRPGGGCSIIDVARQRETRALYAGQGPDQCTYLFSKHGRVFWINEASIAE